MIVHEQRPGTAFSQCGLSPAMTRSRNETIDKVPTCFWCLTGRHFSGLRYSTRVVESLTQLISTPRHPC